MTRFSIARLSIARLILVCLAASGGRAWAWDSPAPDVVLYCTPAMQAPLRQVAALYTASSHVAVHLFVGSPDGQAGLIRHRARADVLVAEAPVIETLTAEHLIRTASIVPLGTDGFVLIGHAGAAVPANTTPAQLVAAHTVVFPDPTSAASFDGAVVLRAALPGEESPRVMGVADTPTVITLVRQDAALLGIVNRTEAGQAGVSQAAALPAPPIPIEGALVSNGQSRNSAALLAFIAGPQGRAVLGAAGLEVKS